MRILWMSAAPWISSGYGVQAKLFVPRLAEAGHEMAVCAYGLQHGTVEWNGIPCYPNAGDTFGCEVIAAHAKHWKADILITLIDAWVLQPGMFGTQVPWVPWFPVDMEPLPPPVLEKVQHAFAPIVFSRFGERMAREAGLSVSYVPHGVDTKSYCPKDQRRSRGSLGLPEDCFLLGSVAINVDYPSRKSLPQLIEAFARFRRRHDDAVLYLHCSRGDEAWASGGINLPALVEQLGIIDSVRVAEGYDYLVGVPEEHMARVYSACDCLLCPSMGEGFGVPILEAQACGCPVIVGDWTSMSELCFEGYRIPSQESEPFWTALNAYQRLPRVDAIVDALEHMYERCQGDEAMRSRARESALRYDADLVAERSWGPTLLEIEGRLKDRSRRISRPLISRRDVPLHEFLLRTETNGFYENLVAPVTAWLDLCVILQLIRCYRPDSFLEVGTHLGHTSRAIAERFPELNIVTVDPGDKVPAARRPALQVDEYLAQERIGEVVAGFANVQVIKEEFANLEWSQGFDMVFLDGDHSYDQVLQDSRMALEILNDPGILIWHDFNHVPDVNRAIETLGLAQKIVSLKDTWIAFYDTCDRMALPVAELQEK